MFQSDHRQAFKFAFALSASLLLSTWLLPYLVQFGGGKCCPVKSGPFPVHDPIGFFPKSTVRGPIHDKDSIEQSAVDDYTDGN
ncbi:hypothetical protein, partial [Candidatus Similichlamydia epinepheli]|uniref:hypothetical protein n=1 Tax=Candidatus Similichlamydia epinepheli TaxID=1903953 RepID=UPI00130027FD